MTPDPNRPNTNQPYTTRRNTVKTQGRSDMPWGWIVGVAAVLILGFIVWSVMDDGTSTTATNNAPVVSERAPTTTGSGSGASPAPVAPARENKGAAQ